MQTTQASKSIAAARAVRVVSRQAWLAGLGAAMVTREWATNEAGQVFRTLVREGSLVESRALRTMDQRVGPSMLRANALLQQARGAVRSAVAGYAETAVTLARATLPRTLPMFARPTRPPGTSPTMRRSTAAKATVARKRVATRKPAKPAATRTAKQSAKVSTRRATRG